MVEQPLHQPRFPQALVFRRQMHLFARARHSHHLIPAHIRHLPVLVHIVIIIISLLGGMHVPRPRPGLRGNLWLPVHQKIPRLEVPARQLAKRPAPE